MFDASGRGGFLSDNFQAIFKLPSLVNLGFESPGGHLQGGPGFCRMNLSFRVWAFSDNFEAPARGHSRFFGFEAFSDLRSLGPDFLGFQTSGVAHFWSY